MGYKSVEAGRSGMYTEGSGVSHMALYIGNNQIIHALSPKYGTIIHDVDYYEKWDRGTWRVAVQEISVKKICKKEGIRR